MFKLIYYIILMKLYETYFNDYIHLNPSLNDCLNLCNFTHLKKKLENQYSQNHIKKQKELHKKYLTILEKKKRPNIYDKTLMYICNDTLDALKYNFDLIPLNHQENMIEYILEMGNGSGLYAFSKKQDYIDFIEKIQIFSEIVDCIIINYRKGIKKKYTMPKIMAEKLIEQLKELLKSKSWTNNDIKYKLDFNFNDTCESIFSPPIKNLIQFLEKDYIKHCRLTIGMCGLPNGLKEYKYLVKSSTTLSNITVEKIHQYGLEEVDRIYNEMTIIKDKMKFKGNMKEFNIYLKKRRDLKFKSKEEVLEHYRNELKTINKSIMKTKFYNNVKGKCYVVPVPKYNEDYSAEAYYMGGDLDGKRNAKFYINLKNIKELNKIEIESLTLHEANPGHHYQITYVNESDTIPLFLKCYPNDAYQEGWALYCENLGKYKTFESYYGKLVLEMLRALRLVVDTGIHYYGWSFNKTFKYYKKYSFDSGDKIISQLHRYIAIPTQALSYKIGEKVILELYNKYKRNNGTSKDFHQKILEHGPIPLELLIGLF